MAECVMTLAPSGESRVFPQGTLIADALFDMGVAFDTPCGGKGTCSKCRVRISDFLEEQNSRQSPALDSPVWVLACQNRMTNDLTVYVPPEIPVDVLTIPHLLNDHTYSIAVDIGTTSVRMSLVDTATKRSFEIASFLNPQRRFGHDVISRIAAGANQENLEAMGGLIRKAIHIRLKKALYETALPGDRIKSIVFSGNTTMLYLLFGLDVMPLGQHPYAAHVKDFPPCFAREIGLDVIGEARVMALPVSGAFTGGDLIGALTLCQSLGMTRNVFFIDLGTNGELFVLDGSGTPFITSCAMGPALEGMNISSGMTAYAGTITRIKEGPDGLTYSMIGEGDPVGITGTTLMDLTAILLEKGAISKNGTFSRHMEKLHLPQPLCLNHAGDSLEIKLWGEIGLTRKDIRQLQLAKAASCTASHFLLQAAGLKLDDIEHVIIAGAFGEHIDLEHFRRLGFIPDFPRALEIYLGNSSLRAAEKSCIDPGFIDQAAALRDKCREVTLSNQPKFQEVFIRSLGFTNESTGHDG
jgi:uncharacterized 2Fe-2S/4Fe-4S cluster protein (DUF4445 family)